MFDVNMFTNQQIPNRNVGFIIPCINRLTPNQEETIGVYRKRVNQGFTFRSSGHKIVLFNLAHDSTYKTYVISGIPQLCAIYMEGSDLSPVEYLEHRTSNVDWEVLGEHEGKTGFPNDWDFPFIPERECLKQQGCNDYIKMVEDVSLDGRLKFQSMSKEEKEAMYKEERTTFTIEDLCKNV